MHYIYIYNITNFSLKKGRGGSMVVNADASEKQREQVLSLNPPSGCELHAPPVSVCFSLAIQQISIQQTGDPACMDRLICKYTYIYTSNASLLGERKAKAHDK